MPVYPQARYWMLTIPHQDFVPWLPPGIAHIIGQLELGEGGFLHWQLVVAFATKVRLRAVRNVFGPAHAEPTKSDAAREYVWKEETRVEGTQFELGKIPFRRGESTDWEQVVECAKTGVLESIPPDIFVRCYNQLRRIGQDYLQPVGMERTCYVFWGSTGTGKSRDAWEQAGVEAYPKDPNSKFWDGYRDHENVVVDEFRGGIAINHLLRWLDRYPCLVEVKGSSVALRAKQLWFTSNLDPRNWYPDLDEDTRSALMRRLTVTHYQ